jgi:anhydro-N-acetylmuramic acid kinase
MSKEYTSLGLMSGTSGDGVDASVIKSDGKTKYKLILDKYFKYSQEISNDIYKSREKVNNSKDLQKTSKELEFLEKKITLFHAQVAENIIKETKVDLVGFHGQTIFHNSKEKISKQLGDGKLLSTLLKKNVIYKFRQNDLENNGEGAPLTPIFHKLIVDQNKINLPVTILNLGGIANITSVNVEKDMSSSDIGPGNCLIDQWIKINSKRNYDENGNIAESGKVNKIILDQALDNFYNKSISQNKSYDVKDFDLSFVRGLSLEDGAATLTEYTSQILSNKLLNNIIFLCGGGRKNKFLVKSIQKKINGQIKIIDDLGIDGDFVESQAFAYLSIRSYLKLPISFPETTGCLKACTGGEIIRF